jgi:hypothetical protein
MEKEEGNENGNQVRAIGMGQGNKTTLVWNNVPAQMTWHILPWKGGNAENLHFPNPAVSYFKRLVDNSMIYDTANQTNLYSAQKDPHKLTDATKSDIEQFICTLIFMSIYSLPHTEMYLSPLQFDIEVKKKKPNAASVPVHEIKTDETGHWPTFTEKRGVVRN